MFREKLWDNQIKTFPERYETPAAPQKVQLQKNKTKKKQHNNKLNKQRRSKRQRWLFAGKIVFI